MSQSSRASRNNRGPGQRSAERYVRLGTQVPPEIKEHYVAAARQHGVSLSIYFEMLAKVDPLAAGPQGTPQEAPSKNT